MSVSPPVVVREARPSELRHLAAIEDSGAPLFREWCAGVLPPALVAPAPSGHQRDAEPGRLLVALDPAYDGGPVGFSLSRRPTKTDRGRWRPTVAMSAMSAPDPKRTFRFGWSRSLAYCARTTTRGGARFSVEPKRSRNLLGGGSGR